MEEEKKILIDKGLSLRSEEVNEVMGKVPHRIFRVGTYIIICIVAILAVMGYLLQVPTYMEVPYIVSGNRPSVGIVSKNAGIVMFRYDRPQEVKEGDTIAAIMNDGEHFYYISPTSGIIENNFLYTTGDNITGGETLARIMPHEHPNYKIVLSIPLNIKPRISRGMSIKFSTNGSTTYDAVGYINKLSVIPDETGYFNATVEMPDSMIQKLPTSGKAKLHYKTENIFEKVLATK